MSRDLLVVTRLGLRFPDRPLESPELFARRLELLRLASQRFVVSYPRVVGWVIETAPEYYQTLTDELSARRMAEPAGGRIAIVRRGTDHEEADLRLLGLDEAPLLTVRLDSDDVYLPDAIDRALAKVASAEDGVMVDFPHGFLLEPQTCRARRMSYIVQGPFLGFTTNGPDLSRIHGNHTQARSRASKVLSIPKRAWVQTVHGKNIATSFDDHSALTHLRQMRREWRRRPANRSPRELPYFVADLLPIRRAYLGSVSEAVGDSHDWGSG